MLLLSGTHPQRSRQSRPRVSQRVHRSAAQSLYGRRSGGYGGASPPPVFSSVVTAACKFNTFTRVGAENRSCFRMQTRTRQLTHFAHVDVCKHSVAVQQPVGDDVSPLLPMPKAACSSGCWLSD